MSRRITCYRCGAREYFGTDLRGDLIVIETVACRCTAPPVYRREDADLRRLKRKPTVKRTGVCEDCERKIEGRGPTAVVCFKCLGVRNRAKARRHLQRKRAAA